MSDETASFGQGWLHKSERQILNKVGNLFARLPHSFFRRSNQVGIDCLLAAGAVLISLWLHGEMATSVGSVFWAWLLLAAILFPLSIYSVGGYSAIWRYFNLADSLRLSLGVFSATVLLMVVTRLSEPWMGRPHPDVFFSSAALYLLLAFAVRGLRRLTFEASGTDCSRRRRALLMGTDNSLASTAREVTLLEGIEVVGLICPNEALHGLKIGSFRVIGGPKDLSRLLKTLHVHLVLIVESGLSCIAESVVTATRLGVDVRLIPTAANVLRNEVHVSAKPRPEDILARTNEMKAVTHEYVVELFKGRTVLVTGAGGSIGSELCRQVLQMPIRQLLLLDQDENSIFEMMNELRAAELPPGLAGIVGDVRDRALLKRTFEKYRPDIVLHAAAYKHVPVMEENVSAAVLNNVVATRELASAAVRYGAERFLMISSDKAVNPSSVMGSTKRIAEMIVHSIGQNPEVQTRCACVRFGNVIGSRGSVFPIFMRQISKGLPVTITDERMTRYFMTIPEAVELVLQASTLGSQGNLYMLDMGQPVLIRDLAEKVIHMSGLRAGKDVPIVKIGARAGEKLHEELWNFGAEVVPTQFKRVYEVIEEPVTENFTVALRRLEEAALERDEVATSEALKMLPINFSSADFSTNGSSLNVNAD